MLSVRKNSNYFEISCIEVNEECVKTFYKDKKCKKLQLILLRNKFCRRKKEKGECVSEHLTIIINIRWNSRDACTPQVALQMQHFMLWNQTLSSISSEHVGTP